MKSSKELTEELERLKGRMEAMEEGMCRNYARVKKLSTQEDKIKELEGEVARTRSRSFAANNRLDNIENWRDKHIDNCIDHSKEQKAAIQSLQEKVKRLEERLAFTRRQCDSDLATTQERIEKLHVFESKHWVEIMNLRDRLSSLETKPQDSRREVIKRARAYEAKDKIAQALDIIDDRLKDREYVSGSELRTIQSGLNQALTIAEQSLEGGE